MKQYISLITFISIVALFTSFAFVSMDLLFSARIEQNQNAANYRTILEHNDIEFTESNLFDTFEANIEVTEYTHNSKTILVYTNINNQNVSFKIGIFEAAGVWGDIIGIMTVNSDFSTLINVSVLQNEEQLGKDVSQRYFLDQFMGITLDNTILTPVIIGPIGDEGDLPNEVDQLAGATGTSNGFQNVINEAYFIYRDLVIGGQA